MHFAILGFLIVLLIGFFVVLWKAAPNWRWYQLVAAGVTMLLAVAFLFPVAGTLKSRAAWHELKEDLEDRLEQAEAQREVLNYGDPGRPAEGEGVVPLAEKLAKLGMEAGRRWRGLQLQNVSGGSFILARPTGPAEVAEVPAQEEPAEDADESAQPLIPTDMIVYAFAETQTQALPDASAPVPTIFLGEFRVTDSNPNAATLQPARALDPEQQQAISGGRAASWSLYELLPLDGHEPFIAEGSSPSDENIFGRVDEELVTNLLTSMRNQGVPDEEFQATLESYLRDGSRFRPDEDPPAARWVKVEFTQDHAIDVDSDERRGALEGGFFDNLGRAVDSRLQVAGDDSGVEFSEGEQIVVKEEAADALIQQGVATLIDAYYVRPLNDYRFVLRNIRVRLNELAARKSELEYEQQVLEEAIEKTTQMIGQSQQARDKLEKDLAQTQIEVRAIDQYVSEVRSELQAMRERVSALYQSNKRLENELTQLHRTIKERVDAITAAPAS